MLITLIGHGRVGTHLNKALVGAGHDVRWLHAHEAAGAATADVVLIAVTDTALPAVARRVATLYADAVVAHTAGSVGMEVFGHCPRCGVFYPMQTFSVERDVDFSRVPLFIEGNCPDAERALMSLARTLTASAAPLSSAQRRRLHVAAVFACNFVNHCVALADTQLQAIGLDYRAMLPLVEETVAKLHTLSPRQAQTGPAARGDSGVIQAHEAMIDDNRTRLIYRLMSESIMNNKQQ